MPPVLAGRTRREPGRGRRRGLAHLRDRLAALAGPLARWLDRAPPRLGTLASRDLRALAGLGRDLRGLGPPNLRELLRIASMNVADLLDELIDDAPLAGALAFDAVAGTRLGPRSPGTVLPWLHRLALGARQGDGAARAPLVPVGGTARLVDALAGSARTAGAQVRTGAPVTRIVVEDDAVRGVELAGGEVVETACVVSTVHPARTLLGLVGARHLDVGLVRALGNLRSRGAAAKLDLALDGLPPLAVDPRARLLVSPGVDALESAYDHVKYGEHAAEPALEITIPSVHDPGSRHPAATCSRPSCSTRRTGPARTSMLPATPCATRRWRASTRSCPDSATAWSRRGCARPRISRTRSGSPAATGTTWRSASTSCSGAVRCRSWPAGRRPSRGSTSVGPAPIPAAV